MQLGRLKTGAKKTMHPELFTIPGLNITVPSYGAVVMLGFLLGTWLMARRCVKLKVDPDIAVNLGFVILIFGTLGARTFYVIHYWDTQFAHQPGQVFNLRAGGMEIYGGLIGGFLACYLYIYLKGYSRRLIADLVAPSLLLAMGIGRIGCLLYGCCWGAPAPEGLPWAVQFPFGSPPMVRQWEHRLVTVPDRLLFIAPDGTAGPMPRPLLKMSIETLQEKMTQMADKLEEAKASDDTKKTERLQKLQEQLKTAIKPIMGHYDQFDTTPAKLKTLAQAPEYHSTLLHPAQLYAAIGPILLSLITGAYLYRRKRHGMVMVLGFALYAVQRFIEEIIRIDNPHDAFGLTASQAVSIGILLICGISYLALQKMPLRSPRIMASMPKKPDETKPEPAAEPAT